MGLTRAALLLALLPATTAAQTADWTVQSVRFEADLSRGDGGADVTVEYVLTPPTVDAARAAPVTFEMLGFGDAETDRFSTADGRAVVLWPTHGSHRAAALSAPDAVSGDAVPLVVRYRIDDAVTSDGGELVVRVPVLTGPPTATGDGAGDFGARVLLPDGWAVSEGFPSGLRAGEGGSWEVTLPTVPAMVGFRGRSDGAWRPGIPLLVDLVTLTILIVFSWFGWRHLRGVAARARS